MGSIDYKVLKEDDQDLIDLLQKMIQKDPALRITIKEILVLGFLFYS
jgi:serine/threonine protein kinase